MLILALDTTTRDGSTALVRDGRVLVEATGDPALTHAQRLPGEVTRVLEAAKAALDDVDLYAVAAGPGSFTGLRVGIATVQGLAMATGRKVVPVPVLDALARAGADGAHAVGAWMDAQRGQVFAALYGPDGGALIAATSVPPAETLAAWAFAADMASVRFVGDGAVRYAADIRAHTGTGAAVVPHPMLAGIIGMLAAEHPERAVLPHALVPIYIRRPDAELARDRRREP